MSTGAGVSLWKQTTVIATLRVPQCPLSPLGRGWRWPTVRRPPSAAAPRGSSQLPRQRLLPRRGAGEARPRSFCSGDVPPLRPLSRDARRRCAGHGEQSHGLTALPACHVPQDASEAEPPSPSKFKASPSTTSRDGSFPTGPEAHPAAAFRVPGAAEQARK